MLYLHFEMPLLTTTACLCATTPGPNQGALLAEIPIAVDAELMTRTDPREHFLLGYCSYRYVREGPILRTYVPGARIRRSPSMRAIYMSVGLF